MIMFWSFFHVFLHVWRQAFTTTVYITRDYDMSMTSPPIATENYDEYLENLTQELNLDLAPLLAPA
jgi:hypothetical protein